MVSCGPLNRGKRVTNYGCRAAFRAVHCAEILAAWLLVDAAAWLVLQQALLYNDWLELRTIAFRGLVS